LRLPSLLQNPFLERKETEFPVNVESRIVERRNVVGAGLV
jgi:hypothetical protein